MARQYSIADQILITPYEEPEGGQLWLRITTQKMRFSPGGISVPAASAEHMVEALKLAILEWNLTPKESVKP